MQKSACIRPFKLVVRRMSSNQISIPRQAGIYVRRSREAQGLTRRELASRSGVSERSLASLELGDATGIRLDKLLSVFNALGVHLLVEGAGINLSPHAGVAPSSSPASTIDRPSRFSPDHGEGWRASSSARMAGSQSSVAMSGEELLDSYNQMYEKMRRDAVAAMRKEQSHG